MSDIFSSPGESLEFPLVFDLRVIFDRGAMEGIAQKVEQAATESGVGAARASTPQVASEKYGKLKCQVTVPNQVVMERLYQAVAAIPGVKKIL